MAAQCATDSLENPLWQFAQAFYPQPDVEDALLELQDDHQADVLLLLAALWLASEWREWPAGQHEMFGEYLAWREHVVRPLRGVRRMLPGSRRRAGRAGADFRSRVQSMELEAEQMGLAGLFSLLEPIAADFEIDEETPSALRALARDNARMAMDIDAVKVSSGQARSAVHTLLLALEAFVDTDLFLEPDPES
jgi:uncharacterized protein (TIGR02444 family)